jgi:hypothetical protein
VGQRHWARPAEVRHAFYAANEGDADLQANGEPSCGAGHTKIESRVRYLGVEVDDALEIAEKIGV